VVFGVIGGRGIDFLEKYKGEMMKKLTAGEIQFEADRKYGNWIAGYGLRNGLKVCQALMKKFKAEAQRRKDLDKGK